jgi:hypothetical protein
MLVKDDLLNQVPSTMPEMPFQRLKIQFFPPGEYYYYYYYYFYLTTVGPSANYS